MAAKAHPRGRRFAAMLRAAAFTFAVLVVGVLPFASAASPLCTDTIREVSLGWLPTLERGEGLGDARAWADFELIGASCGGLAAFPTVVGMPAIPIPDDLMDIVPAASHMTIDSDGTASCRGGPKFCADSLVNGVCSGLVDKSGG